jgi:class 3 adenylate cyclase
MINALAIFTIGETTRPLAQACFREEGACAAPLAAARDARSRVDALNQRRLSKGETPLEFGLALHVGDVMYGNLGFRSVFSSQSSGQRPTRRHA